jgi:hypothetical protein
MADHTHEAHDDHDHTHGHDHDPNYEHGVPRSGNAFGLNRATTCGPIGFGSPRKSVIPASSCYL